MASLAPQRKDKVTLTEEKYGENKSLERKSQDINAQDATGEVYTAFSLFSGLKR